jgi:hypothetical protein
MGYIYSYMKRRILPETEVAEESEALRMNDLTLPTMEMMMMMMMMMTWRH